ncbi:MAG: flippase-like domain-containing protein [Prolixibacteraceae bacterium]|nr:flippase-like domain-containing protein [Prolixibacteraceae bacterium]
MASKATKIANILIFFAIGVLIFWFIYKDQDIDRMFSILKNDVNYFWILLSIILGILSHICRAVRWRYLIEPMGYKPRLDNTFYAVMVGYLMNLVIPRMGEISKCGVLTRYENINFAKLIGTVVTERIFDILVMLFFTLLMALTQFGEVVGFLNEKPEMKTKLFSALISPFLWGSFIVIGLLFFSFRRKIKASRFYRRIGKTLNQFKEGILSVRYIRKKGAFIFQTFFIWILYYLMLYVAFFAFDFTSHLLPLEGLTAFVFGSFGMVAPVQGGIGAWHFMTKEALALYGIPNEDGIVFALLAHGIMTLMIIVVGVFSLMMLLFVNRKNVAQAKYKDSAEA